MNRIIRLNDGAELPCASCGESGGLLGIHFETDIYTAIDFIRDAGRLARITDLTLDGENELRRVEWDGYTLPLHIIAAGENETVVGLKKGAGE